MSQKFAPMSYRKPDYRRSLLAGKLKEFAENWREITSDPVILSWLNGYKLPFIKKPVQNAVPSIPNWSQGNQGNTSLVKRKKDDAFRALVESERNP